MDKANYNCRHLTRKNPSRYHFKYNYGITYSMKRVVPVALAGSLLVLASAALYMEDRHADASVLFGATISVTGTATSAVDPDLLMVRLGVETRGDTAIDALWNNSRTMNGVAQAVMAVGVDEDEISTSRFDIRPAYKWDEKAGESLLVGYDVTNILLIETDNLDIVAEIIDSGVAAGANRVNNVYFTLSPETEMKVRESLLTNAVLNAKAKAETVLAPLQYNITGVKTVSISEFGVYHEPMFAGDFAIAESQRSMSTPIFSSEQDVSATINVVFLISRN